MRSFAALYVELDQTVSTLAKRDAIVRYLTRATAGDAAWAIYTLSGGKLRRAISATEMRAALADTTGFADWLIDESYQHVGDLAETVALMLPRRSTDAVDVPLRTWMEQRLPALYKLDSKTRIEQLRGWWGELDPSQAFIVNKLMTGSLRVGVSQRIVVQALSSWTGLSTDLLAHRLAGDWQPSADATALLCSPQSHDEHMHDRPYPFFLASPLETDVETLGPPSAWLAEWKWDGIRAQLMKRGDAVTLWSRGEERLDGRFPELEQAAMKLGGDAVLDGEILAWDAASPYPRPFTSLQKRIGKLKPSVKLTVETPVCFMAYDLLERDGADLRELPLQQRRAQLTTLLHLNDHYLRLSAPLDNDTWTGLAAQRLSAREHQTEGLMLKRFDSPYRVGRKRGDWWKWKIDPLTIDAVLLYAQPGHGRRSGLFTDYTFGVWDGDALVPIAKAYSGLDDAEISRLDHWIRAHTTDRFGPVRAVDAELVFELAFEAVQSSTRHKSGVAVRFPRVLRWRTDKGKNDADRLDDLRRLATG